MKNGVQTVKSFEAQVHKSVRKIFTKLVDHEARKILDAGVIQTKGVKKPKRKATDEPTAEATAFVTEVAAAIAEPTGYRPGYQPRLYRDAIVLHGSRTAAAKAMGLPETTFRDRLKKEINAA